MVRSNQALTPLPMGVTRAAPGKLVLGKQETPRQSVSCGEFCFFSGDACLISRVKSWYASCTCRLPHPIALLCLLSRQLHKEVCSWTCKTTLSFFHRVFTERPAPPNLSPPLSISVSLLSSSSATTGVSCPPARLLPFHIPPLRELNPEKPLLKEPLPVLPARLTRAVAPVSGAGKGRSVPGAQPHGPCNGDGGSRGLSTPGTLRRQESISSALSLTLPWAGTQGCGMLLPSCISQIHPWVRAKLGGGRTVAPEGDWGIPRAQRFAGMARTMVTAPGRWLSPTQARS